MAKTSGVTIKYEIRNGLWQLLHGKCVRRSKDVYTIETPGGQFSGKKA